MLNCTTRRAQRTDKLDKPELDPNERYRLKMLPYFVRRRCVGHCLLLDDSRVMATRLAGRVLFGCGEVPNLDRSQYVPNRLLRICL